jgi:hypothetical protein
MWITAIDCVQVCEPLRVIDCFADSGEVGATGEGDPFVFLLVEVSGILVTVYRVVISTDWQEVPELVYLPSTVNERVLYRDTSRAVAFIGAGTSAVISICVDNLAEFGTDRTHSLVSPLTPILTYPPNKNYRFVISMSHRPIYCIRI